MTGTAIEPGKAGPKLWQKKAYIYIYSNCFGPDKVRRCELKGRVHTIGLSKLLKETEGQQATLELLKNLGRKRRFLR